MKARLLVVPIVCLCSACASPKSAPPEAKQATTTRLSAQAPDDPRITAILDASNDRITQQLNAWFDEGDFPACIQLLKVQVQMYPHDYDIVTNLGWMQENVEQWSDAEATYAQYKAQNANDPDAPLALADYYFRRKQYDKIPSLLEPAIAGARHPHPNAYRILAHTYDRLKRYSDSLRVWDVYIALAPADDAAKVNRTRVQKKLDSGR